MYYILQQNGGTQCHLKWGGIYHPEIPNKRASATFEVNVDKEEITVLTSSEQTFIFDLDDAELDMAGATGKMLFIKFEGGKITLFSESPVLLDVLRRTILERQVQQVMKQTRRIEMADVVGGIDCWCVGRRFGTCLDSKFEQSTGWIHPH